MSKLKSLYVMIEIPPLQSVWLDGFPDTADRPFPAGSASLLVFPPTLILFPEKE